MCDLFHVDQNVNRDDRKTATPRRVIQSLLELRAALAERRGSPEESRRTLREAQRLFAEMGATGHAERVAGELGR